MGTLLSMEPGSFAASARTGHPETQRVLVLQLEAALQRGYWRLAIRRFLMIQAYEFEVSDELEQRLCALMAICPAAILRRIRLQVGAWWKLQSMRSRRSARGQASTFRFRGD